MPFLLYSQVLSNQKRKWGRGVRGQESVKRGIDPKIVAKARKKGYKISRADRFRYRCRYSPG